MAYNAAANTASKMPVVVVFFLDVIMNAMFR